MSKRVISIIQARMGSSRLPGKILMPIIDEKGCLELMLERVSRGKSVGSVVVATSDTEKDDPVEELCYKLGVNCSRGSENDVLDRFYNAAVSFGPADTLVRLTGDSPLHDPGIIDHAIDFFHENETDYVSNTDILSFPDGLEVEVFKFSVLEEIWRKAKLDSEREHVVLRYMRNHEKEYQRMNFQGTEDYSKYRWTLDEAKDLTVIQTIFEALYPENPEFNMFDVLDFLAKNPEVQQINLDTERNKGTFYSWKERRYIRKT